MRRATWFLVLCLGLNWITSAQAQVDFVYGLSNQGNLITFNAASPGAVSNVVAISGLVAGERLLGIDVRPANGVLYGIGANQSAGNPSTTVYTINPMTGVATAINPGTIPAGTLTGGMGTPYAVNFNPAPDRIRVTGRNTQNLRLNPNDGSLVAVEPNPVTYSGTSPPTPQIVATAYTGVGGPNIQIGLDVAIGRISRIEFNNFNAGVFNRLPNPLGVTTDSDQAGLDVRVGDNTLFAALDVNGASRLYTINYDMMTGGAATEVGIIGGLGSGERLIAITFAAVPEPTSLGLIGIGATGLFFTLRRRRNTRQKSPSRRPV